MEFKIGDKVLVEGRYRCEILNVFDYDGEVWIEVIPIWENAVNVTREVTASVVRLLEEEN